MPPGYPLRPDLRAAIVQDVAAGEMSCRRIARKHGVGASTVSDVAREEDLSFDRARTAAATAAHVEDMKAQRAALAQTLLDEAEDLLTQIHEPARVFNIGGKDNTYTERILDRPPTADIRNLMTSAAVAIDKHVALTKVDASTQAEGAVSLVGALAEGFQKAYEQMQAEEAAEAVGDDDTDHAGPRPNHSENQP